LIGSKNPGHSGVWLGGNPAASQKERERCINSCWIDVSKERFSAAGMDSGERSLFPGVYDDSKGFEELLKAVRSLCEEDSKF